jgi:DNA-binding GntR family transcriptional regulator
LTAVEHVRNTLRAAILRGDLPGESRLVQTDIAAQLKVSTTPVREAMRDLASEGLITLDNHRIGTVRIPDWEEMVEIVEIRRELAHLALARSMSYITGEELARARDLAAELSNEQDLGSWVQKNIQFHLIFHEASRTVRLSAILSALEEAGGVFVAQAQRLHPEIRRKAIAEHSALLDAFDAGDVEAAVAIQHSHVNLALQAFEMESDG